MQKLRPPKPQSPSDESNLLDLKPKVQKERPQTAETIQKISKALSHKIYVCRCGATSKDPKSICQVVEEREG